jgi:hypothetical protein
MANEYSWDLDSNKGGEGGNKAEFVKFPEGITRVRVIDTAPYQRWTHYINKQKRSINCPGKGCPICEIRKQEKANKLTQTYPMAKRFALNVINRETGRVEILEQGKIFIQDLKDMMSDLKGENATLQEADIKVRRRGTGKDDTSYRLDIDKVYPLSDADKTLLEKRIDLAEYFAPHDPEKILRIVNGEAWDEVMKSNQEEKIDLSEDEPELELE